MRRFLALLLLATSAPAMAGGYSPAGSKSSVDTQQQQNNENVAASQSAANQQNQSRSESIGGNLNNYQINNAQGELGVMSVRSNGITCESPSFYINGGVLPQDAWGFYTFEQRNREMMYAPQASIGLQMPFGPQVASCTEAMKDQAMQTKIATETGILKQCINTKVQATKAEIPMELVNQSFPQLGKSCSVLWGLTSNGSVDPVAQLENSNN